MEGLVLKGIGGFYYVKTADGTVTECRARGRFRKEGSVPMVGDHVLVENGMLSGILPRRNALTRPFVANADRLLVTLSLSRPKPDLLLADKLLLSALVKGIAPVLVLTKADEADPAILRACTRDYAAHFPVFTVSSLTGEGIPALAEALRSGVTCLAGQSAAGKSSLLNALLPGAQLETGGLAARTDRGRHTTRHAELLPYGEGYLCDTPGFSLFDPEETDQEALDACYPEFAPARGLCRFPACSHLTEPGCAVRPLVAEGMLSPGRYERYGLIRAEIEERKKHRYD